MKHMLETGTTLLYVSHQKSSVEKLCDHALWIEKGHTVMSGEAKEVCRAYMSQ